jgi:hypothetical protein
MWEVQESSASATLEVNGSVRDITVGADLKEVVIAAAREAGFGKFRFYIDSVEVLPQNAPVLVEAKAYKIAPYDVAGVA